MLQLNILIHRNNLETVDRNRPELRLPSLKPPLLDNSNTALTVNQSLQSDTLTPRSGEKRNGFLTSLDWLKIGVSTLVFSGIYLSLTAVMDWVKQNKPQDEKNYTL